MAPKAICETTMARYVFVIYLLTQTKNAAPGTDRTPQRATYKPYLLSACFLIAIASRSIKLVVSPEHGLIRSAEQSSNLGEAHAFIFM